MNVCYFFYIALPRLNETEIKNSLFAKETFLNLGTFYEGRVLHCLLYVNKTANPIYESRYI